MKKPAPPREHIEQVTFVRWFRSEFPAVRIIAIPNGGYRDARTAERLHAEGVSAGVPDLYVPAWGLWIEMKRAKGGRVTPEQTDWHDYLRGIGDTVIVGRGWEGAAAQVRAYRSSAS